MRDFFRRNEPRSLGHAARMGATRALIIWGGLVLGTQAGPIIAQALTLHGTV